MKGKRLGESVPPANELATIYLSDDYMTIERLVQQYGASYNAIRVRLAEGLTAHGTTANQVKAERYRRRDDHSASRRLVSRARLSAVDAPRCSGCEMLLPKGVTSGRCEFCQPGAVDYVTFMAATYYEGL